MLTTGEEKIERIFGIFFTRFRAELLRRFHFNIFFPLSNRDWSRCERCQNVNLKTIFSSLFAFTSDFVGV